MDPWTSFEWTIPKMRNKNTSSCCQRRRFLLRKSTLSSSFAVVTRTLFCWSMMSLRARSLAVLAQQQDHRRQQQAQQQPWTVGACLVTLGRHDTDASGAINATEFAVAAQASLYDPGWCLAVNSTTIATRSTSSRSSSTSSLLFRSSNNNTINTSTNSSTNTSTNNTNETISFQLQLLDMYWQSIFMQAACTCRDYESSPTAAATTTSDDCCSVHPVLYRPGHYNSSAYTYTLCSMLSAARDTQCLAIQHQQTSNNNNNNPILNPPVTNDDETMGPTTAPMSAIVVARSTPTATPTAVSKLGATSNNNSEDSGGDSNGPWYRTLGVALSASGALVFVLLGWIRVLQWREQQRQPEARTVAKGNVTKDNQVVVDSTTPEEDEHDDDDEERQRGDIFGNHTPFVIYKADTENEKELDDDHDGERPLSPHSRRSFYMTPYSLNNNSDSITTADLLFDSAAHKRAGHSSRKSKSKTDVHIFCDTDDEASSSSSSSSCSSSNSSSVVSSTSSTGSFNSLGMIKMDSRHCLHSKSTSSTDNAAENTCYKYPMNEDDDDNNKKDRLVDSKNADEKQDLPKINDPLSTSTNLQAIC